MNFYSIYLFYPQPFSVPEIAAAHSLLVLNFNQQLIACSTLITSGKCNITRGYFKFREGISPYERAFIQGKK